MRNEIVFFIFLLLQLDHFFLEIIVI